MITTTTFKTKKTIFSVIIILVIGLGSLCYMTISNSIPKSNQSSSSKRNDIIVKKLADLGFNVGNNMSQNYDSTCNMDKIQLYWKKYGLKYMSDIFIAHLISKTNLILADPDEYTGVIPQKNIEEMITNMEMCKKGENMTHFYINNTTANNGPVFDYIDENNVTDYGKGIAVGNTLNKTTTETWLDKCVFHDIYNSNPKYYGVPLLLHYTKEPRIKIIAPESLIKKDEYNKIIDNRTVTIIPNADPMVLLILPGNEGYVVLTEWKN